jgi:hypothetical protein
MEVLLKEVIIDIVRRRRNVTYTEAESLCMSSEVDLWATARYIHMQLLVLFLNCQLYIIFILLTNWSGKIA